MSLDQICKHVIKYLDNRINNLYGKIYIIGQYEEIKNILELLLNQTKLISLDNVFISPDYEEFIIELTEDGDLVVSPLDNEYRDFGDGDALFVSHLIDFTAFDVFPSNVCLFELNM